MRFLFATSALQLLFGFFTYGQLAHIDSLEMSLKSAQENSKIDILNQLMKGHLCKDNAKAEEYYQYIQAELATTDYAKGTVESLKNFGTLYYCSGRIDSALIIYQEAIDLGKKMGLNKIVGAIANNMGNLYRMKGDLEKSLTNFQICYKAGIALQDTLLILASLDGMGVVFRVKGQFDSALQNFLKVEKIAKISNRKNVLLSAKINKASIYFEHRIEKLDVADLLEAQKLALETNNFISRASIAQILGGKSLFDENYDQALKYFKNGLDLLANLGDGDVKIALLHSIGNVYFKLERFREAIDANVKAIQMAERSGISTQLLLLYGNNASNYLQLKKYTKARDSSLKGIALTENLENINTAVNLYMYLAKAYEGLGQFENAYQAQIAFTKINNEYRDKSQTEQLDKIEVAYETEKKEAEIVSLSQQSEIQTLQLSQQKYLLAGFALLIVFGAAGGALFYRQRKIKQQQVLTALELEEAKKRITIEKLYRESALKAIRSQMNPHFVFNALNSIQDYIMSNEKKLAGKYLGKFADLMRIYLEYSKVKTITLKEEMDALSLYLELEKLRFEDTLVYNIEIGEEVDQEVPVPSLLIQPYVENAIKHGLLHKVNDRKLTISVDHQKEDMTLICQIVDNGIGRTKSHEINQMRNPDHKSFATQATKSRIELLNHDRQNPIKEEIIDLVDENGEGTGTKVVLRIPPALEIASESQTDHSEVDPAVK